VTVKFVEPEMADKVAPEVAVPGAMACAKPAEPAVLLIVLTAFDDELHDTVLVKFAVLPSE
jgi:hypothetical protein